MRAGSWSRLVTMFTAAMIASLGYTQSVGVTWEGSSGMAKRVLAGMQQSLGDMAPQIQVEVAGEQDALDGKVNEFCASKDAVVVLRSSGAKYLGKNPPSKPAFIGACNNPVQLGAVSSLDKPGGDVTGVTYYIPAKVTLETFKEILPEMKSIVLLVEEGHPGAAIDTEGTKAACGELQIQYDEVSCASLDDALKAVNDKKGGVDAIIIGAQAMLMDNTKQLVSAAGNTPILAFSSKPVKEGALAGLAADDTKLGQMLGESIVEVLVNGKPVSQVPVKTDPKPQLFINVKTAETIGTVVPYELLSIANVIE